MQRRAFLKRFGLGAAVIAAGGIGFLVSAIKAPEFTFIEIGGPSSKFNPLTYQGELAWIHIPDERAPRFDLICGQYVRVR